MTNHHTRPSNKASRPVPGHRPLPSPPQPPPPPCWLYARNSRSRAGTSVPHPLPNEGLTGKTSSSSASGSGSGSGPRIHFGLQSPEVPPEADAPGRMAPRPPHAGRARGGPLCPPSVLPAVRSPRYCSSLSRFTHVVACSSSWAEEENRWDGPRRGSMGVKHPSKRGRVMGPARGGEGARL